MKNYWERRSRLLKRREREKREALRKAVKVMCKGVTKVKIPARRSKKGADCD